MTISIDTINCLLVVALAAEAKPIVQKLGLRPVKTKPYRCYQNATIALIESGVGAMNAAAATAYALAGRTGNALSCVNIGIAGGRQDLGTLLVAHRIEDLASGKNWYPQLAWKPSPELETVEVITVAEPTSNYKNGVVFDMEASGFVTAATRHTTLDLIQSLKIVSDNPEHTFKNLHKKDVSTLIENNMHRLEQCISDLQTFAMAAPDTTATEEFLSGLVNHGKSVNTQGLHFSSSQTHELRRLLERHLAVFNKLPDQKHLCQFSNSRELIRSLDQTVDGHRPHY